VSHHLGHARYEISSFISPDLSLQTALTTQFNNYKIMLQWAHQKVQDADDFMQRLTDVWARKQNWRCQWVTKSIYISAPSFRPDMDILNKLSYWLCQNFVSQSQKSSRWQILKTIWNNFGQSCLCIYFAVWHYILVIQCHGIITDNLTITNQKTADFKYMDKPHKCHKT